MRVPTTLLLVLVTFLAKASAADDIYWEGDDDLANEFLEVDRDVGIGGHLRRLKRDWFDWWQTESTEAPETEDVTQDDDQNEDEDNFEIDSNGSGALEPELDSELKEKTLRVTFVVKEPYHGKYSNRDSPQFQNFSRSLADAVNNVFRDLPGTHRASLVRIQSRPADEFSCKVTLDIIVTGDDTKRTSDTLRDYIRTKRVLGNIQVDDEDYTDTVLPTGVDNEAIDSYNEPEPERGDANPEFLATTTLPDIVQPNEDDIYGERPIGVEGDETTEEIIPEEGGSDYERPGEYTPFFGRPDEQRPDEAWPNGASPDDRRNGYDRTTEGRPNYGQPDYRRPDYERTTQGRPDYGRPDYERTTQRRPDYGQPDYGRPDYERTTQRRPDYGQPDYGRPDYERTTQGRPDYGQPDYGRPDYERTTQGRPDYGQPDYGRPDYERTTQGRPDYGQPDYGRPDYERTTQGRPDYGQPDYGRPDYERTTQGRPDYGQTEYGRPDYERTTEGRPDYERTTARRPDYERPDYGRSEYENTGRPGEGRDEYGRPSYERPTEQRPDYGGQGEYSPYPGSTNYTCPDGDLKCDYTRCVPSNQRCDGRRDCDDGADEAGCPDHEDDKDDDTLVQIDDKKLLNNIPKEVEKAIKGKMRELNESLQFHSAKSEEVVESIDAFKQTIKSLKRKNMELTNKPNNLQTRVGVLEQRLQEMEQEKLTKCVEIANIPCKPSEVVKDLVQNIALKLKITTEGIMNVRWLPGKKDQPVKGRTSRRVV